jgi:nitrile hydratase
MTGPHDLGGQHGLGPIECEEDEPLFHAEWERRVFALTLAMGARGDWNIDASRHARENRHPVDYLSSSYYELWMKGLERLMTERGLVTPEEIDSRLAGQGLVAEAVGGAVPAERLHALLRAGDSARRNDDAKPRFFPGDQVRTRTMNPRGHTRLPRYARGRLGVIERIHGTFVFPDSNARGQGEQPQHLYSVAFSAAELWGEDGGAHERVFIDLFEDYLLPIEESGS